MIGLFLNLTEIYPSQRKINSIYWS